MRQHALARQRHDALRHLLLLVHQHQWGQHKDFIVLAPPPSTPAYVRGRQHVLVGENLQQTRRVRRQLVVGARERLRRHLGVKTRTGSDEDVQQVVHVMRRHDISTNNRGSGHVHFAGR